MTQTTRLPLPEPDKSETHGFEGWSFGVDGAKKTSDHTYKIHWWREAKMHARATALTLLARKVDVLTLAKISRHKDIRLLSNVYYRESADAIAARI